MRPVQAAHLKSHLAGSVRVDLIGILVYVGPS